jgi:hypothetical protein
MLCYAEAHCAICLEPLEADAAAGDHGEEAAAEAAAAAVAREGRVVALGCGHLFHAPCFTRWEGEGEGKREACPLCGRRVHAW